MVAAIATPKTGPAPKKNKAGKPQKTIAASKAVSRSKGTYGGGPLVFQVTGVKTGDRAKMLAKIRGGLHFRAVKFLEVGLAATQKEIAQVLTIPQSTLTRRKAEGRLHGGESDRAVRFAQLKDSALALMQGNNDAAIAWLRTPLDILGGETPLQHATTELGARDVEDLIGRIRHGVFS